MTTTYPILASVAPHYYSADGSDIYQTTPYCDNNPQILIEFPFDIDRSVVNLQISEGSDVPYQKQLAAMKNLVGLPHF